VTNFDHEMMEPPSFAYRKVHIAKGRKNAEEVTWYTVDIHTSGGRGTEYSLSDEPGGQPMRACHRPSVHYEGKSIRCYTGGEWLRFER